MWSKLAKKTNSKILTITNVCLKKQKRLDISTQILTFLWMKRDIFLFSPFFQSLFWSSALSFDQHYRNIDIDFIQLQHLDCKQTLTVLRGDKVLDEGICSLGVEGECVLQGLQLLGLVHVGHLQTVSSGVEVLLDNVQRVLQHGTLLWSQALWSVVL